MSFKEGNKHTRDLRSLAASGGPCGLQEWNEGASSAGSVVKSTGGSFKGTTFNSQFTTVYNSSSMESDTLTQTYVDEEYNTIVNNI